jgi:hypothetical protein
MMLTYDMKKIDRVIRAEADRCLQQWAINRRHGYVNLKAKSSSLFYDGIEDYYESVTQEDKCLEAMIRLKAIDYKAFMAAHLAYEKVNDWYAGVLRNGGWTDNESGEHHKVVKANQEAFKHYVHIAYKTPSSTYSRRLRSAQNYVAREVLHYRSV